MEPVSLGLAALSMGGSFLSSMGAGQASAKQGRLQMIEDNMNRLRNQETIDAVNIKREALGRELLTIPEVNEVTTGSWVDVDGMMAAAERAGFNPVTFLNAGGLAAYTHGWQKTVRQGHNAADAFKMMLPEYALSTPSQVPQQYSPLSALGGAITAGANTFGTMHRADMSYDLQMARLLAAGSMQGMGLSDGNGFARVIQSGAPARVPGLAALTGGKIGSAGGKDDITVWPSYEVAPNTLWEAKKPEVTNPFPPQWGWSIPPGYADAQAYEDAGTEIWSWPYSIAKGINTVLWNTTGNTAEGHFQTARQQVIDWKAVTPNMTRYSGTPWATGSMSP